MPTSNFAEGPHLVDRHVGRKVQEKRLSTGYSQSDLGRAIGLTFQQIQKYEKGSNRISASKLWEIASFLQVDIGYFFKGIARPGHADLALSRGVEDEAHPTRSSLEIARLATQLSGRQQRLFLELIRSMSVETNIPSH